MVYVTRSSSRHIYCSNSKIATTNMVVLNVLPENNNNNSEATTASRPENNYLVPMFWWSVLKVSPGNTLLMFMVVH